MIVWEQRDRLITLHTKNATYQMKVDGYGVLLHTWYGPRIGGGDLSRLIRYADRGFSPNPAEAGRDRTYSLDTLPQEFSCAGAGDFRLPALELELPDGSHAADLRYVRHEIRPGKYALEGLPAFFSGAEDADTLIVTLEDRAAGVSVELLYGVFEEYDLITRAVRVINRGEAPVCLCRIASLCLDLPRADLDLITLDGSYAMERRLHRAPLRPGVQSVGSVRGMSSHQHNPFAVLCDQNADEEHGLCWGAILLYSGNFEAAVERGQFEDARLTMGIHPFHFRWTLGPGETFTAPETALVCSPGGLGPMSRQFHRAIRERLLRDPYQDRPKPVLLNSWEAFCMDFDQEKLLSLAGAARELGVELFVLDDGWFGRRNDDTTSLGDWSVNLEKLPDGLRGLCEKLRGMGMGLGLWIEPEMVSEDSELYRAHPDWALCPPGRPHIRSRQQLVLDFTRPEVREYVFRSIRAALEGVDIKYIKWDMNRPLAQVWSPSLPPERQGEFYHRYVLGVYDLLERFRREWPQALIEGCAGGGGRFDAGMLYYAPQIWCSDNTDAVDRLRIQYGTSFAYPPCVMGAHVSACPNGQNGRTTPLETRGTAAMSGAFGYELDVRELPPEEKKLISRQIAEYQENYDLIRRGDYYRLSPPGAEGVPAAWAHVSPDRREALVSIVAGPAGAARPFRTLRLRGLDPALNYLVEGDGRSWPGDVLMAAGWPVPSMGEYECIRLRLRAET